MSAAVPYTVKAKFPYSPSAETADDDLPFEKDQLITVTEVVDDDWLFGTYTNSNGALLSGYFPKSFAEQIEDDATAPAPVAVPAPAATPLSPQAAVSLPETKQEPQSDPVDVLKGGRSDTIPSPTVAATSQSVAESDEDQFKNFKSKLSTFNTSATAAPPMPFQHTAENSYVKRSFSGASPHSSYVPPSFNRSPQDQKVIPVKVERPADIVSEHTVVHEEGEEAPKLTLKQRMQMLEQRQQEEQAAMAAAMRRKQEKKNSKKVAKVEGNTTGGSILSSSTGGSTSVLSPVKPDITGETIPESQEARDMHVPPPMPTIDATEGDEENVEEQEEVSQVVQEEQNDSEDRDVPEEDDESESDGDDNDDEEDEEDEEELRKRQLRERMAKLSGGMGMMGMMGFGMPAPTASKPKKTKKTKELEHEETSMPAAVPILPFAMGSSQLPPALAKSAKSEAQDIEDEDEPETPKVPMSTSPEEEEASSAEAEEEDIKEDREEEPLVVEKDYEPEGDDEHESDEVVDKQVTAVDNNAQSFPPELPHLPSAIFSADNSDTQMEVSDSLPPPVPHQDEVTEAVDEYIDSSEEEYAEEYADEKSEDMDTIVNSNGQGANADLQKYEEEAGSTTGYEADEDSNFATAERAYTSPSKPKLISSPVTPGLPPPIPVPSIPRDVPPPPVPVPSASTTSIPRGVPPPPPPPPAAAPPTVNTYIPSSPPPIPSPYPARAPPPPVPAAAHAPAVHSHTSHLPPPPPPPSQAPAPAFQPSAVTRKSMEIQQVKTTNTGTIIPDVAPEFSEQWWVNESIPSQLSAKDVYFETESHEVTKRGGRRIKYIDYYILSMDYSQKIWELSYDLADTSKLLTFSQVEKPAPPHITKSYLEQASRQYGSHAIQLASGAIGSSMKEDLIQWTLNQIPNVLHQIGNKTFGATIYRNNNNTEVSTLDEVKPGDVFVVVKGKFESSGAFHKKTYELGMKAPYVAIISSYDHVKNKFRVIEQSPTKGIHNNAYKPAEMRSGRIRVFRLVGRDYIGW